VVLFWVCICLVYSSVEYSSLRYTGKQCYRPTFDFLRPQSISFSVCVTYQIVIYTVSIVFVGFCRINCTGYPQKVFNFIVYVAILNYEFLVLRYLNWYVIETILIL
jgi:hypothetical protein